ncbi:hypothetical protein [Larkinella terrae]|uniref:Uncharacterized protein n=1 Tax=Larkinella terrae TaxID=2025311 RepID=A0A7K0EHE3_9BACT|nr:hypothetical protein [Larkinella terrae]MRS61227.1 hypothetical protein [Larkinella terrae]
MATGKKQSTQEFIDEMRASTQEILPLLDDHGIQYNIKEWVSISEYAKLFRIDDTNTILGWINNGTIPSKNIIEIPVLKGLKLIKAIPCN